MVCPFISANSVTPLTTKYIPSNILVMVNDAKATGVSSLRHPVKYLPEVTPCSSSIMACSMIHTPNIMMPHAKRVKKENDRIVRYLFFIVSSSHDNILHILFPESNGIWRVPVWAQYHKRMVNHC